MTHEYFQCNVTCSMMMSVLLMRNTYKGMYYSVRTTIPTTNYNSTVFKNTEYTDILKADQLVYHTRFKMLSIAKYS